jgi:3-oxoacyl-[acyl-carrier protein] reductase
MAAISMDNYFLDKTKEEFMNVLEVNLVGAFLTSKIYSKYIDDGMIVNISSTDGIDTYNEYNIDYATSKCGMINMSKNISMCTNNKVICICPNWIDSDSTRSMDKDYLMNELKRIGQSRLIKIDELNDGIYKIINDNRDGIYRIDVKGDKLWIEKM